MKIRKTLMALSITATALTATAQNDLMTPETLWEMGRIGNVALSPDGNQLIYAVTHYDKAANRGTTTLHRLSTAAAPQAATALGAGSSPAYIDRTHYAYIQGGNLFVCATTPGATPLQIATDVDDYLFSSDGHHVILIRQVPSTSSIAPKEDDLPLSTGMVINDLMYKHWDHYVTSIPHPFVYAFDGKTLTEGVDLLEGEPYECPMEPFGGVEQLAWSPDGKYIAYTCRKKTGRDYALSTDSDIFLYDVVRRATVRNLCKPEGYAAPAVNATESLEHQAVNRQSGDLNLGYDQNPRFSPDGRYVAWISMERDGYESDRQRLCVYDLRTGQKTYVTESFQSNVEDFVWSPTQLQLYFTGVWHGTTNLYATNLSGHVTPLTKDTADYVLAGIMPDGKTLVAKRHSMQRPDDIYLVRLPEQATALATTQRITDVNASIYKHLAVGDVRARWVTTTDGQQMLCWVVYPPHFDPAKKYPTLLFCEGGPQSPVSQFWSYRWNFQIMAANGYIVIAPNRRGLPGFGMEWLEAISGDYTGQCMQDYLSAIDDISRESYVDETRLGAVGASFGGFSVYWLAGNHNGRFKAFIAHDGIYNTQQQYVETEEMWFPNWDLGGAPWVRQAEGQMRKAYAESPHLYVSQWDTPILCIHGQRDFRIEYTQAESAFAAARLRGLDAQLLLFPDENHWVLKPQNGILWQRTFFRFLDKYLK